MPAPQCRTLLLITFFFFGWLSIPALSTAQEPTTARTLPTDDGYRGIWYMNQPTDDAYRYKYSGGFATYPQQHVPSRFIPGRRDKTFFVYGGTPKNENRLLHMVSYYDHKTGTVPRPRILLDKQTDRRPRQPDAVAGWLRLPLDLLQRARHVATGVHPPQRRRRTRSTPSNGSRRRTSPIRSPGICPTTGFCSCTPVTSRGNRRLFWMTSADGVHWREPRMLSYIQKGHYQMSWRDGDRLATAFNVHPEPVGLNARTNLYYLETPDGGRTWRTVEGKVIEPPLTEIDNPALVHDYQVRGAPRLPQGPSIRRRGPARPPLPDQRRV